MTRDRCHGLLPLNHMERLVVGLRNYEKPTEVRIYDATTGNLLRIEQPDDNHQKLKPIEEIYCKIHQ